MQTFELAKLEPVATLEDVCKSFGSAEICHNLTWSLPRGEITLISGPSGCGKTTVLNLLARYEQPDSGKVWLDPLMQTAVIFQNPGLIDYLTIGENLELVRNVHPHAMDRKELEQTAKTLGIVSLLNRMPNSLSGGQKQRVSILRALGTNCPIILCDEPISAQNHELKQTILDVFLHHSRHRGTTFLIVSHDLRVARWASKHFAMEGGQLHEVA